MWLVDTWSFATFGGKHVQRASPLLLLKTLQTPFSPLSREDTGVLERTQEMIHQEEWKERTREKYVPTEGHGYRNVWESTTGNA
jgi:hypothetical protein